MRNFKLQLYNFKQGLTMDDLDIDRVVTSHMVSTDQFSEKELVNSLKESLTPFTYKKEVKVLLEAMQQEIEAKPLTYELKDLYRKVERQNYGLLYRDPLNKILDIINLEDDQAKMEHIINDLSIYDYVPEIRAYLYNINKSPIDRQNMTHAGKAEPIYSIVEKIEDGHLVYVADRWFHLGENQVQQTLVENHINNNDRIRLIRMLEHAMATADITGNDINFEIDGNLTIGVSTKDGSLSLNGQKADGETTLENLFNSPIIPYLKKDFYPIILAVKENVDKFVELDVAMKVSNILKPTVECYAFNYKDKMYLYNIDRRVGSSWFQYESVTTLINDISKELDYDITPFFENKLSKELKVLRTLEEQEQKIEMKIKEVNESIEELKDNKELLEEDKNLKMAFDNLLIHKHNLTKDLLKIKEERSDAKRTMIVNK